MTEHLPAAGPDPAAALPSPELAELATAHGVATDFWDWRGQHVVVTRESIEAVLAALGVAAHTEESVRAALTDVRDQPWRRTLPPCVVVRSGRPAEVPVHVPHGEPVRVHVDLETGGRVDLPQADRWVPPRVVDGREVGEATFTVPGDLPLGWHDLVAESGPAYDVVVRVPLVVTPDRLELPARVAEGPATWGLMTQLYSVRSRRSWGHGDLDDLAELARWGGEELGAGFVLINPLHAPSPTVPVEPSPYLPVTRRFTSPLYIRVEQVPEHAYLTGAVRAEIERTALMQRAMSASPGLIDRDAVWEAKRSALTLVHSVPSGRGAGVRLPGVPRAGGRRPGRLRDVVRARRGARREVERVAGAVAGPDVPGGRRGPGRARGPGRLLLLAAVGPRRAARALRSAGPPPPGWRWASSTTWPSACTSTGPTPGRCRT